MHFGRFRGKRYETLMEFFELPRRTALKGYSTGQKNQFEVIMALCQGAEYILMDEPFAGNDVFNREDFYKVLLGILEPEETVFLSTHLIEEVERFIGRAVLLKGGRIAGDVSMLELEERGSSLLEYVKETADFLIEIMPVMFIPAAVGLLESWSSLAPVWVPIAVITGITTVLVMVVTGQVTQYLIGSQQKKKGANSRKGGAV